MKIWPKTGKTINQSLLLIGCGQLLSVTFGFYMVLKNLMVTLKSQQREFHHFHNLNH